MGKRIFGETLYTWGKTKAVPLPMLALDHG